MKFVNNGLVKLIAISTIFGTKNLATELNQSATSMSYTLTTSEMNSYFPLDQTAFQITIGPSTLPFLDKFYNVKSKVWMVRNTSNQFTVKAEWDNVNSNQFTNDDFISVMAPIYLI